MVRLFRLPRPDLDLEVSSNVGQTAVCKATVSMGSSLSHQGRGATIGVSAGNHLNGVLCNLVEILGSNP